MQRAFQALHGEGSIPSCRSKFTGSVAQLGERQPVTLEVEGSKPFGLATFKDDNMSTPEYRALQEMYGSDSDLPALFFDDISVSISNWDMMNLDRYRSILKIDDISTEDEDGHDVFVLRSARGNPSDLSDLFLDLLDADLISQEMEIYADPDDEEEWEEYFNANILNTTVPGN